MSSTNSCLWRCRILAVALAAGASGGCEGTPAGGAPHAAPARVAVETVIVEPSSIPLLVDAVGALESPQSTLLAAEVSGIVTFLDVPEGTEVEKGRVLARIDRRQAEAQLSVAAARYRNARETHDRLLALHDKGLISRQELDDAAAQLEQAAGELAESRTGLQQTDVRAPFAGQLGLRQVSLGAFVEAGEPLVRLTQTDPLRLVFTLPERDASLLRTGQSITGVAGDCTARFATEVSIIDPTLDASTRSIRAQAVVANPERRLRAGMSARLSVEVGRREQALTVPHEAVVRRGTMKLLYVVQADGSFEQREATVGRHFRDRVEIVAGIAAGETVVVAGQDKIRPGASADPRPWEPVENPKLALGVPAADCELR